MAKKKTVDANGADLAVLEPEALSTLEAPTQVDVAPAVPLAEAAELAPVEAGVALTLAPLFAALAAAQGEFEKIFKTETAQITSSRGAYSYGYAPQANYREALIKPLVKYGLFFFQWVGPGEGPGHLLLHAMVAHSSGAFLRFEPFPIYISAQASMQDVGKAVTYARRYQLAAVFNLAAEDNDAADVPPPEPKRRPQASLDDDVPFMDDGRDLDPDNPFDGPAEDGWDPAWQTMKDYRAAMNWGQQRGQFNDAKHFNNAWAKVFRENLGHVEANAPKFLASWRNYINRRVRQQAGGGS